MNRIFLFILLLFSLVYADIDSLSIENESVHIVNRNFQNNKAKKIFNSFVSLLIPGYNSFVQKKYLKGSFFVINDLLAISGYYYYDKKGNDKWEESHQYADQHFNPEKYENFVDTVYYSDRFLIIPDIFSFDTLGHVFNYNENGELQKNLNYYEMIGKYRKFTQGWDDVQPNYNSIIEKFGQIYIPIQKGDSVLRYASKYPNSNNENFRMTPDTSRLYYVNIENLNKVDRALLCPSEYFFGNSNHVEKYMSLRSSAHDIYKIRDYMLWIVAVNHLSSFIVSIYDNFISDNNINEMPLSVIPYTSDNFDQRGVRFLIKF